MRYFFIILFLHFAIAIQAGANDSDSMKIPNHYEYKNNVYWKKHKVLKACAFSTLGLGLCGTATGFIGIICNLPDANSNWREDIKIWEGICSAGLCLTATSIPLFVVSHHYKKKAKNQVRLSINGSSNSLLSLSYHF